MFEFLGNKFIPRLADSHCQVLHFLTGTSTSGSLKSGRPSCTELQDLANEIQDSWQQIGRRLKLCEENLSSINFEEENVYEKSYRMLRKWTEAFHDSANYGTLAQALEHELVNRGDLALKYCYTKHPAETPQGVSQSLHYVYFM